ncbi:MAG: HDOD domain-containing protein, partial [Terracidiphilus sp.]
MAAPDHAMRLAELLAEDPVDLARVSDEIRSQPELAAAVKRIAASLQLLPAGLVTSVEEAVIVLGTERLRVLLHAWPTCEKAEQRTTRDGAKAVARGAAGPSLPANEAKDAVALAAAAAARMPELLYLAGLVRLLGIGEAEALSSDGGAAGSGSWAAIAELTEMLVRDFLALI